MLEGRRLSVIAATDVGARQPGVALGGHPVAPPCPSRRCGRRPTPPGHGKGSCESARLPQYAFHPGRSSQPDSAHLLVAPPRSQCHRRRASSAVLELLGALDSPAARLGPTPASWRALRPAAQDKADAGRLDRLDPVADARPTPAAAGAVGLQRVVGPDTATAPVTRVAAPPARLAGDAVPAGPVSTGVEAGGDDSEHAVSLGLAGRALWYPRVPAADRGVFGVCVAARPAPREGKRRHRDRACGEEGGQEGRRPPAIPDGHRAQRQSPASKPRSSTPRSRGCGADGRRP